MLEPNRTYTAAQLIDIGLGRVAELGHHLDEGTATTDDRNELEGWIETLPAIRAIKDWGGRAGWPLMHQARRSASAG
jgi:hypothetical protein